MVLTEYLTYVCQCLVFFIVIIICKSESIAERMSGLYFLGLYPKIRPRIQMTHFDLRRKNV